MTANQHPTHPFAVRDFRFYWLSRICVILGQMGLAVVISWQVYDIARQTMGLKAAAFQLGLIGLAQFVPLLLLTLYTGWIADRFDRRRIAQCAILLEIICAAILGITTWLGTITLPILFTVATLFGVTRAFAGPALQGITPNVVPQTLLPTAIAYSSVAWQLGAIVGPAAGGYLYAAHPMLPYAAASGLLLFAMVALHLIRPLPGKTMSAGISQWQQMIEGLHYVRRNRLVLGSISLDFIAVLLAGATAMLPVYARDILHVGSEGLGHLRAAPAIGAGLVALWFGFRPLSTNVGTKMLWSVALFGLATVIFGLSHLIMPGNPMVIAMGMLAALGALDMVSVYVRQSLVQIHTPDEMRGRVGAVSILFISGSNELGEAESGMLAALIGPVAAVVAGGIGAIIVTGLWAWLFPELRKAKTFTPPEPSEPAKESAT